MMDYCKKILNTKYFVSFVIVDYAVIHYAFVII